MSQVEKQAGGIHQGLSEEEQQALREGALIWTIGALEEEFEKDALKVWKMLPSNTKAHIRRLIAIESLMVGELNGEL